MNSLTLSQVLSPPSSVWNGSTAKANRSVTDSALERNVLLCNQMVILLVTEMSREPALQHLAQLSEQSSSRYG
jgi:hypothetical protein